MNPTPLRIVTLAAGLTIALARAPLDRWILLGPLAVVALLLAAVPRGRYGNYLAMLTPLASVAAIIVAGLFDTTDVAAVLTGCLALALVLVGSSAGTPGAPPVRLATSAPLWLAAALGSAVVGLLPAWLAQGDRVSAWDPQAPVGIALRLVVILAALWLPVYALARWSRRAPASSAPATAPQSGKWKVEA